MFLQLYIMTLWQRTSKIQLDETWAFQVSQGEGHMVIMMSSGRTLYPIWTLTLVLCRHYWQGKKFVDKHIGKQRDEGTHRKQ